MTPAEVFSPAEYIEDELRGRKWRRSDLAAIAGIHTRVIDELLDSGRPVTWNIATALAKAFGTSPEMWMSLQRSYERGAR